MYENEGYIFDFLYDRIGNEFGVAGLMGNLMAESGLNPTNLQSIGNTKLGVTDQKYTDNVDSGKYSKIKFCYDKFGYGIAQWSYRSRKQDLYDYAKEVGTSIGDLHMQLEFLWKELQGYSPVLKALKNAKTVEEATDIVLEKYEKPVNQSEKVKEYRMNYGHDIYNRQIERIIKMEKQNVKKYVKVNAKSVNIRIGPSTKYKAIDYAYRGELLPFVEKDEETGWYKIRFTHKIMGYENEIGYVTNRYTSIVEDS